MASIVNIADLQPAMILAEDLRAYNGRLLLPRGTCLTGKHIKIMRMWGVVEAHVEDAFPSHQQPPYKTNIPEADLNALHQMVHSRFCHVPLDYPVFSKLCQCAFEHLAVKGTGDASATAMKKVPYISRKSGVALNEIPVSKFTDGSMFWDDFVLPTLPEIFIKINEALLNPHSSAYEIADIICNDASLTTVLLKMANSSFYGYPGEIDSIRHAVIIIGAKQLTTLSYAINILGVFKKIPAEIIDMASFWQHSVATGICARSLASYRNIQNTERLFVAGLLHDIGRLLLYQYAPDDMVRLIERARASDKLLYNLESEILNIDHATIGACLLKKWKLPETLEDIINCHHRPAKAHNSIEATIVHVADIITNAMGIGSSGEYLVPALDIQAWERLGLSENTLGPAIQQMDQQMADVLNIFFPDEKKTV